MNGSQDMLAMPPLWSRWPRLLEAVAGVSTLCAPVAGLGGYNASVAIQNAGGDFPSAIPADAALRITVTVAGPANVNVVLQGYRLRYAPNAP